MVSNARHAKLAAEAKKTGSTIMKVAEAHFKKASGK